ncbi:hypothetical protein AMK26_10510 [Streptomyces sp. CB03234]|uniref:hypothetical protein n=1 Tax=Streptomyces sp. (strain CB03234) TaxID=1703937 RepID=UPI00093B48C6|nr:hypothetical protein [Streptomyces sp. CB03234]OKK06441.1 hypothetical protein AMK26_10510 [Streptomyces sp. CB03234]
MPEDWIGYAALLIVVSGLGTLVMGVACVVLAVVRGGRRLFGGRRARATQPEAATPTPAPVPYIYRACHTPVCGHMHTRHYPAGPGQWVCGGCHATVAEV